jgi:hypothetical protein
LKYDRSAREAHKARPEFVIARIVYFLLYSPQWYVRWHVGDKRFWAGRITFTVDSMVFAQDAVPAIHGPAYGNTAS